MSGPDFVADTNIMIYFLEGDQRMAPFADYQFALSSITEIELLGWPAIDAEEISVIRSFLNECTVINLNSEVKETAISIKQSAKIKTPDAIIAATAMHLNLPLLTADKDFKKIESLDLLLLE